MTRLFIILGEHLFDTERFLSGYDDVTFYMAEDAGLTAHQHTHRLVLTLGAMRQYADALHAANREVTYRRIDEHGAERSYTDKLEEFLLNTKPSEILHFEIENKQLDAQIATLCVRHTIQRTVLSSPMFLTTAGDFSTYRATVAKPTLATFYEWQRKRLDILVDSEGRPAGGTWMTDSVQAALPAGAYVEPLPQIIHADRVHDVMTLVKARFGNNPGDVGDFWLPTNRAQAKAWFEDFLIHRFTDFGLSAQALSVRHPFLHHSVLAPCLNIGLLTPDEVVRDAIAFARVNPISLESLELFIRGIIGTREFARASYHATPSSERTRRTTLASTWNTGDTGILPLDHAIKKAVTRGYLHAAERQTIVRNVLQLCEVDAGESIRWFCEHLVDADAWAVAPNLHEAVHESDEPFVTALTIANADHVLAISDYPQGFWCDILDGLYWRYIERHKASFSHDPRLASLVKGVERLDPERRKRIFFAAEAFLRKNTIKHE